MKPHILVRGRGLNPQDVEVYLVDEHGQERSIPGVIAAEWRADCSQGVNRLHLDLVNAQLDLEGLSVSLHVC